MDQDDFVTGCFAPLIALCCVIGGIATVGKNPGVGITLTVIGVLGLFGWFATIND